MARWPGITARIAVVGMAASLAACPFQTNVIPSLPRSEREHRVVLVIVDGLRLDVLRDHLAGLERLAPSDSGLRLLRDHTFELALSEHAETIVPSYTIGAMASIATGLFPDRHGITGNNFHELGRAGPPARYDFDQPYHASQGFYLPGVRTPAASDDPRHLPLLSSLLPRTRDAPHLPVTMYELLGPRMASAVVLHQFGTSARWMVPTLTTSFFLGLRWSGTYALDAFDEAAAREAKRLLQGDPPRLTTIYFAGVDHRSHHQGDLIDERPFFAMPRLPSGDLTLAQIQAEYLRTLDRHLADLLRAYRDAHPDLFAQTTFLLVADHGHLSRTRGAELTATSGVKATIEERRIGPELLFRWLAQAAPDEALAEGLSCRQVIAGSGDPDSGGKAFLFSGNGGMAHLYVNRTGSANTRHRERLGCLERATRALLARKDAVTGAGAVVGATLLDPSGLGHTRRAGYVEALLRDEFARKLGPRAERRKAKMRLVGAHVDHEGLSRSGEVVLFVSQEEGWIFANPGDDATFSDHGGLDDDLMQVPLLVASRELAPGAARAIERAEGIETTDVVPTILAILESTPPPGNLRDPLLVWRTGGRDLAFNTDRRNEIPEPEGRAGVFTFHEAAGGKVRFGLRQSRSEPPKTVDIKAGAERFTWKEGEWLHGAGQRCRNTADEWSCEFDFGKASTAKIVVARLCPAPGGGGSGPGPRCYGEGPFPLVVDEIPPRWWSDAPRVLCADDWKLKLVPNASDDLRIGRVVVSVADPWDVQDRYSRPFVHVADASPREGEIKWGCEPPGAPVSVDQALERTCEVQPGQPPGDRVLEVSLPYEKIALYLRAREALGKKGAGEWQVAGQVLHGVKQPKDFILTITVCDRADNCVERPLLADVQYDELRARGCGR